MRKNGDSGWKVAPVFVPISPASSVYEYEHQIVTVYVGVVQTYTALQVLSLSRNRMHLYCNVMQQQLLRFFYRRGGGDENEKVILQCVHGRVQG